MKKLLTTVMIGVLVMTSMAFAGESPVTISAPLAKETFHIHGAPLSEEVAKGLVYGPGKVMVPLEAIAAALGFEVEVLENQIIVSKGAMNATILRNEDGYAFSRMAYRPLGAKPHLRDGLLYVPVSFFSEVLPYEVSINEEGLVSIDEDLSTERARYAYATIEEFLSDRIKVELNGQPAYVTFDDQTKVTNPMTNEAMEIGDLKVGDSLTFTTSMVTLAIYPAQYYAYEIEVINEIGFSSGTIHELGEDKVLIGPWTSGTMIMVDEATEILNQAGEPLTLEDLHVGNQVKVYHSMAMTMSIPGQTHGYKIIVE